MAAEPSPLPFRLPILPARDVHSGLTFHDYVYEVLFDLALSMQCDGTTPQSLAWRLYRQISRQGKTRRGHYEVRLPHLVRVVCAETACSGQGKVFASIKGEPGIHRVTSAVLCVHPSSGVRNGLYLCSVELDLSNQWWQLESTEFDFAKKEWILDDMLSRIPPGQPTNCEVTFTINILQYTSPYAMESANISPYVLAKAKATTTQSESADWSWLPTKLRQAVAEFNKVFVVGQ